MKLLNAALGVLMAGLVAMPVFAHDDGHKKKGNNECPVGLVSGMSMDDEFGPGHSIRKVVAALQGPHKLDVIEGADHFFAGRLDELQTSIDAWASTAPWENS